MLTTESLDEFMARQPSLAEILERSQECSTNLIDAINSAPANSDSIDPYILARRA